MVATRPLTAWHRAAPAMTTFVLVIVVIGCLWLAQEVLIPTALAVLLTFMLAPLVNWLQKRGLRRGPAVFVVVIVTGVLLAGTGSLMLSQLSSLADKLPSYQDNILTRIEQLQESGKSPIVMKVQSFVERIHAATTPHNDNPPTPVAVVAEPGSFQFPILGVLGPLLQPMATAGLVIVLVIYMLIHKEDVRNRMLKLAGDSNIPMTTKALDDVGRRISRYLLAQFILNAGFGIVIGVGLMLAGLPHALLWGVSAGLLRYIPMLGPWIAAILPVSLSLLMSDGWMQPVIVIGIFVAFELLSNLIIEPQLYGQRMGVSVAGLLVAIAFWTWLWGPIGLMMAAPLTVCLVVMGKYVPQLKFFDIMLGDAPALTPDVKFYQRLLARDQDEASDIAKEGFEDMLPLDACERLFVSSLVMAKTDLTSGQLQEGEAERVRTLVQEIADEQLLSSPHWPAEVANTRARLSVLGCAAADENDAAALHIFREVLDERVFDIDVVSKSRLVSEIATLVEQEQPSVVCIVAIPPGGIAHTRLLCKRLRARCPNVTIVVARWGAKDDIEEHRTQLQNAGAHYVGTSLQETATQLLQLAQLQRIEAPHEIVPEPHAAMVAAKA